MFEVAREYVEEETVNYESNEEDMNKEGIVKTAGIAIYSYQLVSSLRPPCLR